jgi:hypothetical protein
MKSFLIFLFTCFFLATQAQNADSYVGLTLFLKDAPPLNGAENDFSYRNFVSSSVGVVYRKNIKRQITQHVNYVSRTSARLHYYLEAQANLSTNGYTYRFADRTYRTTYQRLEVPLLLTFRTENINPVTTFFRRNHLCIIAKMGMIFAFQAAQKKESRSLTLDKDWTLEEKLDIYKGVYPAFSYQFGLEKVLKNKQILQATLGGQTSTLSKHTTAATINGKMAGVPFSESC